MLAGFVTTHARVAAPSARPAARARPRCRRSAQGAPPAPWLDPALLAAAKAEGTLTVYSSTNEQEGLPLFKIFEEATGIKVQYVRGSDFGARCRAWRSSSAPASNPTTSCI